MLQNSNQGIIQLSESVISSQEYLYQRFHSMGPKEFEGSRDPLDAIERLNSIHSNFDYLKFNDEDQLRAVVCILRKDARYWSETTKHGKELKWSTWFGFKIEFHKRYCNQIAIKALEKKFFTFTQGEKSVVDSIVRFEHLAIVFPYLLRNRK